jgi:hypothetical protein
MVAILVLVIFAFGLFIATGARAQADPRSYQHGIDFVKLDNGDYWLIWASSGNPPTGAAPSGNWTHDVYYSRIVPSNPKINPQVIISNPEAQEPASSAISNDGHIMVTMEDGWTSCCSQRYGVYDSDLNPVNPYPNLVHDGGHSGHVAAVDNRFVVFYSDEWVDGGGVNNLGTGDDVLVKVYGSNGDLQQSVDVAVGRVTRDWWPVVAGSNSHAILVWQRFVEGETYADLMVAILDPAIGVLVKDALVLEDHVKYYTYDVQYISAIDRFLVVGTYDAGGGFVYLLDNEGNVLADNKTLPATVRESQLVVREFDGGAVVVQPTTPTGVMVLSVTPSSITLEQTIADDYEWQYSGTDGIFVDSDTVYIVSLSSKGLVERTFDVALAPTVIQPEQSTSWLLLGLLLGGLVIVAGTVTALLLGRRRQAGK